MSLTRTPIGQPPQRKVRQTNMAAERRLQQRLGALESRFQGQTTRIQRGILELEDKMKSLSVERQPTAFWAAVCEEEEKLAPILSRHLTPDWNLHHGKGEECPYGKRVGGRCSLFPCVRPATYHSLGFNPDPKEPTWSSRQRQTEKLQLPRLAGTFAVAQELRSHSRFKTLTREKAWNREVSRRRDQHAREKPRSWETNYGDPIPFKRLYKPARLEPISR